MKLSIYTLLATIFYFTLVDFVPFLIRSSNCLRPSQSRPFCDTLVSFGLGKLARSASYTTSWAPFSIVNTKNFRGLVTAVIATSKLPLVVGETGDLKGLKQQDEKTREEKNEMKVDVQTDTTSSGNGQESTSTLNSLSIEVDTDHNANVESYFDDSPKQIEFTPSVLHYANSPACIPSMADFTITNNFDHSIQLTAVTSDNSQYYPVLFQPQSLAANNSLNIQLLFLPYYIETSEATLKIASSEGVYEYKVIGRSIKNPYNLHPLSGFRVPAGVSHEQSIFIKNPHAEVLQVREIFTTEDFLSLKGTSKNAVDKNEKMFRDSVTEGHAKMWEIQPGEEKEVVILMMSATIPGSYNGYVHIKTDKDNIVIPIDLNVVKGGLFASPTNINFGTVTSSGVSENTVKLWLMNSDSRDVLVHDILPLNPDKALIIKRENRVLKAGQDTLIATLSFDSRVEVSMHNKVLVMTNNSNPALATVEVPYEAHVLYGGISIDVEQSTFFMNHLSFRHVEYLDDDGRVREGNKAPISERYILRNFTFSNDCRLPAILESIDTASCGDVLSIKSVPKHVAQPYSRWGYLPVSFDVQKAKAMTEGKSLPFTCWIHVKTNISAHAIDIYIANPQVKVNGLAQHVNFSSYSFNDDKEKYALDVSMAENLALPIIPESRTTVIQDFVAKKPFEQISAYIGYISTKQSKKIDIQLVNHNPWNTRMRLRQASIKEFRICVTFQQPLLFDPELFSSLIEDETEEVSAAMTCISGDQTKNQELVLKGYAHIVLHATIPSVPEGDDNSNCIDELCFLQFDFETKYQYMTFRLFYMITTGQVSLSRHSGSYNVVLGSNDPLTFSVHSSYEHNIQNFYVDYISDLFDIKVQSGENMDDIEPQSAVWNSPFHLENFRARVEIRTPSTMSQALLAIEPQAAVYKPRSHIELPSVYRYTINVLKALNNPYYDYLLVSLLKIDAFLMREQLALAHMKIREYKDLLATPLYSSGIALNDINLTFGYEFVEHTTVLANLSLHLEHRPTPVEAKIEFPPLRVDHISVFYIEVHNYWQLPISYSFSERNNALVDPKVVSNIKLNDKEKAAYLQAVQQWSDEEVTEWCDDAHDNCDWTILGANFQYGEFSRKDPDALPINDIFTLTSSEIVIPPNSTGLIGPNVFVPHLAASKDISEHAIYLRNNFTGVDKISFTTQDSSPKLIIASITSRLLNESDGTEASVFTSLPSCNNKDLIITSEDQAICTATNKNMKTPVHISNGDSLLRISVKNIGGSDTSASVVVEDGNLGKSNAHYPRTNKLFIRDGEEVDFLIEAVSDCKSYSEQSRLLIIPSYGFAKTLQVDLSFNLSADGKKICLESSYGPVGDTIVKSAALIVIIIYLYQIFNELSFIYTNWSTKLEKEEEMRKKQATTEETDGSLSSPQDDKPQDQEKTNVEVINTGSEETTSAEIASCDDDDDDDDDTSLASLQKSSDPSDVETDEYPSTKSSPHEEAVTFTSQPAVHERVVRKDSSMHGVLSDSKKLQVQQQPQSGSQGLPNVKRSGKSANINAGIAHIGVQKIKVPSIRTLPGQENKAHLASSLKSGTGRSNATNLNTRQVVTNDNNGNNNSRPRNDRVVPLAPSYSSPGRNANVNDMPKSLMPDSRPTASTEVDKKVDKMSLSPLSRRTKAADSAAVTGAPSSLVSSFDELRINDDAQGIGHNRRVPAIGEGRRNQNVDDNQQFDDQLFPTIGEEDVSIQSILKDIMDSNKQSSQPPPMTNNNSDNFFLSGLGRDNRGIPVNPPPGYGHHVPQADQATNLLLSPHNHAYSQSMGFTSSIPLSSDSVGNHYSPFSSPSQQDTIGPSGFFSPGNDSLRGLESFWGSGGDPLNLNVSSAGGGFSNNDDEDWEHALKTAVSDFGIGDEEITFDNIGKTYGARNESATQDRIDRHNAGASMFGDFNAIPSALEGPLEKEENSQDKKRDQRRGPPPTVDGW